MSKFVVNVNEAENEKNVSQPKQIAPAFGDYQKPEKPSVFVRILKVAAVFLFLILLAGSIAGYFYWQNLKRTPQYSLALLVDAARRDDQRTIDELVDTDAIVEDFMPQITNKAVELYGRGLSPSQIQKVAQVSAPLMPAVKQRARAEIPGMIREKTKKLENIPFWAIAVGAKNYLDISPEGDRAVIKSKLQERQLELILKRNGNQWQLVGIRDEELARRVAEKIGQNLIAVTKTGSVKKAGEQLGVSNLENVLKNVEDIFK